MEESCLASIKGVNGIIKVYNDRVSISRKTAGGFLLQGIKGDRDLFFSDIKSVEFKKATMIANGYIQFITTTELATNQKVGILSTSKKAAEDPNAIIIRAFNKETVSKSIEIYELVKEKIKQYRNNGFATPSPTDEIRKFKALLDDGIINQDEFDAKKAELLNL